MAQKQLKECPYCGGKVQIAKMLGSGITAFYCEPMDGGCGAYTSFITAEAEIKAIKAWNRRPKTKNEPCGSPLEKGSKE